ncbi:MAG: hypothetical protein H5T69_02295 [Chloroflexi bacterium]|nr:hypothetical protein [Chloroflexota bacterium]
MNRLGEIVAAITALSANQIVLGLVALSAFMLVIEDRRIVLIPLVAQYILLAVLSSSVLYRPVMWVRWGLGIAIGLLLYITASHMQRRQIASLAGRSRPLPSMGFLFRIFSFALSALAAYGLWRAYPSSSIPPESNLAGYLLMIVGIVMMISGVGPLRAGLGVLVFMNGFEAWYFFLERSLLAGALLGALDILAALGIVVCTESWLQVVHAQERDMLRGEEVEQ